MPAFFVALAFIFLAEMGDKTQLVALAFATVYPARIVMAGILLATLVVHLFSVALGQAVGMALPIFWIKLVAGLAFIGFSFWTLRGDEVGDDEKPALQRFGPLLSVAATFFLAELGDKTMLATVAIASRWSSFYGVWLGSTLGMVAADGLAVMAGKLLDRKIPEELVKYGAAACFAVSGLVMLTEALIHRS
jgi:putative Ca2+/H+ antiporter (TMEM165/GDT1 family)